VLHPHIFARLSALLCALLVIAACAPFAEQPAPAVSDTPTNPSTLVAATSAPGQAAPTQTQARADVAPAEGPPPNLVAPTAAPPTPRASAPNTRAPLEASGPPSIANVQVKTDNVARYDKFEAQFDVTTAAAYLNLPFDPAPPAGLQPAAGVSVDAVFSNDGWTTVITQPAFLDQPYTATERDGRDHLVPSGAPRWSVRFAPTTAGAWQYRLRVQDAGGVATYPEGEPLSFTVGETSANAHRQRGYLRVSETDRRYFAFENGDPFIGVGFNDAFGAAEDVERRMQGYEQHKINFVRVWLSSAGINGSQWTSWASHFIDNDGYLPGVYFDTQNTYNGADLSLKLDSVNQCLFADFWQGNVPVEPNATYNVSARVKLNNVTPASDTGGFAIKLGGWLEKECASSSAGTPITTPTTGTTDWTTISGTLTTRGDQYWLDNLYLARQDVGGGEIYIDDVRLWRADDPAQVNLLRDPNANSHMYFDPMNAARWDRFIELAEQHGVYLKIVVDEKNEWIRNRIDPDGMMTQEGSNDNFYGAPGTKTRWLQEAWWRYIIARWGYSTAIHSFEYVNEGDPYSGTHHEAANAFAQYLDRHSPARTMATTSFWAGFPNKEIWSNSTYTAIDYADLHAYVSTGWGKNASFLEPSRIETRPEHVRSGGGSAKIEATDNNNQAIGPRGLVIRGPGEWVIRYWMKADNFSANCQYETSGGMQRIRWQLDGGNFEKPQGSGPWEGIVPSNSEGKDFICTSPGGSFDWTQFSSDRDRDGKPIPATYRLILPDDRPYELSLRIENTNGTAGTAWIDDIELVSPEGQIVPVVGAFDTTALNEDTAWLNRAYGDLHGGASPTGAQKPLVRGETGVDTPEQQEWDRDLLKDTEGIWLHNNLWGQVNPGGMYDLFWWTSETISTTLHPRFLAYRNFMENIPIDNGNYRDANAQTSDPLLRAWGQRDDTNGRAHIWIQNTQHTWKNVVAGADIPAVDGTITLPNMPAGSYQVTWWDTYKTESPTISTETIASDGALTLKLPQPLGRDVAVKVERRE
jgi:hypothetical protein